MRRLLYRIRYGVPWDAAAIGAVFAVVLGYGAWLHLRNHQARKSMGEPCHRGDDCRSGMCLELYEPAASLPVVAERRGGVCSSDCKDDADCPADMRCAAVVQESAPRESMLEGVPIPIGETNAKACAPR